MRIKAKLCCMALVGTLAPVGALSHAPMDYETMKPRKNVSNSKTSVANFDTYPCGSGDNSTPGPIRHYVTPGGTFEVVWVETIDHPSKYIVDLVANDATNDPLSAANAGNVVLMDEDGFYNDNVTPQNMANKQDRTQTGSSTVANPNPDAVYRYTVTIPTNVKCQKCALRVMQKMFDSGSVNEGTVYSQCTDVMISANLPPEAVKAPTKPTGLKIEKIQ